MRFSLYLLAFSDGIESDSLLHGRFFCWQGHKLQTIPCLSLWFCRIGKGSPFFRIKALRQREGPYSLLFVSENPLKSDNGAQTASYQGLPSSIWTNAVVLPVKEYDGDEKR